MSSKKLKMLRQYIDDNITNDRIRRSITNVNAFVFFVFKSNEKFRLCVDYKKFNAITLKNRISLSFIDETLNRLIDAKYFIKFDFKNAYHRIKIKFDDE